MFHSHPVKYNLVTHLNEREMIDCLSEAQGWTQDQKIWRWSDSVGSTAGRVAMSQDELNFRTQEIQEKAGSANIQKVKQTGRETKQMT